MIKPTLYLVENLGRGILYVMAKPAAGDTLEAEFKGIADYGIDRLVCLLEQAESVELGLQHEQSLCEKHEIEFVSFPIRDLGLPASLPGYSQLVQMLYQDCMAGTNTVIHCRAGIGRTGMVAAGVLIHHGLGADEAFRHLSAARTVSMPDTAEQQSWVRDNYRDILGYQG